MYSSDCLGTYCLLYIFTLVQTFVPEGYPPYNFTQGWCHFDDELQESRRQKYGSFIFAQRIAPA